MNSTSDQQQQPQLLIDRNGLISTLTATPATVITSIKATMTTPPDKLNIRDQILNLQHCIDDINREYSGLNEKRNVSVMKFIVMIV
ncbi:hypothetical protein BLA29_013716 [Euroglyphus maynei]|uniref:Uncharacterized protein n=1 Tax=Euroglyphus maynei TaxID=6958 RepID=A0A1Y3BAN3_EURMA|nr:hypothetical protein BLA29_013716 [Euroglyphus maynei]